MLLVNWFVAALNLRGGIVQESGFYLNNFEKVLGNIRLTQWRTADDSCTIASGFDSETNYCFAEYCPAGQLCFPTEDTSDFGPNGMFKFKRDVHYQEIPVRWQINSCTLLSADVKVSYRAGLPRTRQIVL